MNKIYSWALQNAPEIDRDMLAYLVGQLDDPVAERFTNALLGLVDVTSIYTTIPRTVPDTEYYRNLKYKSYNYLQDDVTVSCEARYTRYFPTKEAAENWENNPEMKYVGNYEMNESNPFPGVRWGELTRNYSLDEWMELSNRLKLPVTE